MARANVAKLHVALAPLNTMMLTTIDCDYRLVSRPMAVEFTEFDGLVRLFAPIDAPLVAEIAVRAPVTIAHTRGEVSVSIAGLASIIRDPYRIARYWHDGLDPWIPGGPSSAAGIEVIVFEGRCRKVPAPAPDSADQAFGTAGSRATRNPVNSSA
ncbi:pyridoxamine 5'-phosphate oxidase family protein [Nocardia sp. NPDC058633]|uniref:pyridoxamine 5'-phosphate oxidase family protein n=1 Tax=Nocardia sp. NPDC058633 TaxID=3346568 RepID=UPI0036653055